MEDLLIVLAVIVLFIGPVRVIRFLIAAFKAVVESEKGGGSVSDEFTRQWRGIGPFETRLRLEHLGGEHELDVYRIDVRGVFPVNRTTQLVSSAAVFDITDAAPDGSVRPKPVACSIEQFQEPESISFQDITRIGQVESGRGFKDWQSLLAIVPDALIAPRGGRRSFRLLVALYDEMKPIRFTHGFIASGEAIAQYTHDFCWNVASEGYEERADNRRRAEELTLELALIVAYADGSIAAAEGNAIKTWASKRVGMLDESEQPSRKKALNDVMRGAGSAARDKQGRSLGTIVTELKQVASKAECFEAIELCLEVMSSDDHADNRELQQINQMARSLGVDIDQFDAMKDKKIAALSLEARSTADFHDLLGIDTSWSQDQVRRHLNKLYSKWNSRAESLLDPDQRDRAERMLETIATARQALIK